MAGTCILDHYAEPEEVATLAVHAGNSTAAGIVFSLASPNNLLVPSHPAQRSTAEALTDQSTCSVRSPNDVAFIGVPKTDSITAMAWVKLGDMPRQKEACVLSHGSWEKGWKLSMYVRFASGCWTCSW